MEKTNQNLLQKLTQILNVDKIMSPDDVLAIRDALIGVLANNKKELESLTDETKQAINSILDKVLTEHDTYLEKTKQIAQEAKSETTEAINSTLKSLEEVKALCKEVMECKPENGEDADEEYVIGEVLNRIKLPEYKEIVLDDGGAIVDKINSLPVNEENQIDAKHIKNLPEGKGGRVISGGVTRKIVEQMIEAAGGGGTPGGSTAQLQYNNAGAFGGISGATTDGTAVTYTAGNLIAADITASGSGGLLLQSNNGTDALLIGAGGGAGATFYGGVNIAGNLTVDTNTLYVDATNNRVGILTTSPAQALHVSSATTYQGIFVNGNAAPNVSFAQSAGTTAEWKAGISGNAGTSFSISSGASNADRLLINSSGFIGLNTNTNPTHTLTLASTGTGIALYNTADQTTNYERMEGLWSSNEFLLRMAKGGTGTQRNVKLVSHGTLTIAGSASSSGDFIFIGSTSGANAVNIVAGSTYTATSGVNTEVSIKPVINQSTTAGYTALLVNPTETTTGSGSKLLADFQVGGTSRFSIDNNGATNITRQVSGVYSGLTITNTSTAAGDDAQIVFRVANLSTARAMIRAVAPGGSDTDLAFYTSDNNGSATEKVRINAAGQLSVTGGVTKRVVTTTDDSTAVIDVAVTDVYQLTAIANNTTFSFTGTPTDGQNFIIRYKDAGVSKTLTWTGFTAIGVTLPTATTAGKWGYVGVTYNSAASQYHVTAVTTEA